MNQLIVWLQEGVSFFVPMVVLLGSLIFVHELGHFLVAKFYKVRVEIFSLGFGPKIFKFKRGDTLYAISAIPLGGYVKMYGDDPTADVPDDQKSVSFTHKPVGQRIGVVLAGPLMNFFFAIVLFVAVALVGEQMLSAKLGDIEATSAAYTAGFRSGDVVTKVADEPVQSWEELQAKIEARGDQPTSFAVIRENETQPTTFSATPKTAPNKNVLSWEKHVGEIEGLSYMSRASIIGIVDPQSPAGKAGLKTGDIVTAVNGTKVDKWRTLVAALGQSRVPAEAQGPTFQFTVQRQPDGLDAPTDKEPQVLDISVAIAATTPAGDSEAVLKGLGIEFPETFLAGFDKTSPAKEAGLKTGDKVVGIDNKPVRNFSEIATIIRAYGDETAPVASPGENSAPAGSSTGTSADSPKRPLLISVIRDGQPVEVTVVPHFKNRMNQQGREERRFEIGIKPMIIDSAPATFEWSASNGLVALRRGISQTLHWTSVTALTFVRLFQAEVSAKNISGFISIGQMAKKSWQIGRAQFMNIMAIISINLFILNLLPVPVLDGGHLMFFSIEALRGAPLSMRKLEIAQQVGLILLLGLMVFALFNDVTRIFN